MNDLQRRLKDCGSPCVPDSSLIKTENSISIFYYDRGAYDSVAKYANLTITHAKEINFKKGLATAYNLLGLTDMYNGRGSSSIEKFKKSLATREELKDDRGIIKCFSNMGLSFGYLGNLSSALEMYNKALEKALTLKDKNVIAACYSGAGGILVRQGNYSQALKYMLTALRLNEEANNKDGMAVACNSLGSLYQRQNDLKKSLDYFERALRLRKELDLTEGVASTQFNIGTVYFNLGKFSEAERVFNEALINFQKINDKKGISYVYSSFADIYENEGKTDLAIKYLLLYLKISEEMNNREGITGAHIKLGKWYLKSKEYNKAEEHAQKALAMAKDNTSLVHRLEACNVLYSVYEGSNRHKEALSAYKIYIEVKDSLVNEENTKSMVKAEMNYAFEKKQAVVKMEQEKKDAIAMAERKRQRIVLLAISGFGLLVLAFAIFAYRSFLQKKKANIAIKQQKDLIEEKQKEILDSIRYARRIQSALLTNEYSITRQLNRLNKRS